jgi:hypothetical protein
MLRVVYQRGGDSIRKYDLCAFSEMYRCFQATKRFRWEMFVSVLLLGLTRENWFSASLLQTNLLQFCHATITCHHHSVVRHVLIDPYMSISSSGSSFSFPILLSMLSSSPLHSMPWKSTKTAKPQDSLWLEEASLLKHRRRLVTGIDCKSSNSRIKRRGLVRVTIRSAGPMCMRRAARYHHTSSNKRSN